MIMRYPWLVSKWKLLNDRGFYSPRKCDDKVEIKENTLSYSSLHTLINGFIILDHKDHIYASGLHSLNLRFFASKSRLHLSHDLILPHWDITIEEQTD